ncbi:tetratricopeptide repeat protein [Microcoleus sp. FACHB-1515]|uniref:tetratricopeptide repeat protein n=1 Tax=Cyanophyceae TaxID=3028117 RepID=UPI001684D455|nr:tetratricopeptide repeat protein [Microcoleus sp. FACHB-1515]MBD2088787.1 tetratricopeptide repeat protein [Microcoleus sp. FACHB-1515]
MSATLAKLHFHRSNWAIPAEQLAQPPALPLLPAQFTGRQAETQQAIALWQRLRPRTAPKVMAIVGQAGVGKSAFAVHLAHQIRSRFTNGQVYLNLRSEPPLSPAAIEQQICRALSVEQLSELSDRRILLLLDAIETAAQLQPLLKLSEDCTILVTSAQPLAEIDTIELQPLSSADGIALLQAIAPAKPILAEAKTAKAIVQLCDNLPLPLCLIAALLQQPQLQLDDCLQQLMEERKRCEQAHLSYPAIRASFHLSYRRLDAPTARLLRRIGVLVEPTLTAETAAALSDSIESAQASLALLRRMRLLEWTGTDYRLPDLLRRLVKSQLAIEESTETRQALRLRLAQHYQEMAEILSSCWEASRSIFERDRSNFLAAIDWAIQAEAWPIAIPTIASLTPFMLDRGDAARWLQMLQTAIAAAASSDALPVAQLHNHLGNTYAHLGDWEKAKAHYQQSLQHLQDRQEPIREAQTIANLGLVYRQQNNLEAAAMQWAIALGRLPAGSAADRAMIQWMQSIDEALLQKAGSRVDRPAASNLLGAIGGIFKRIIS